MKGYLQKDFGDTILFKFHVFSSLPHCVLYASSWLFSMCYWEHLYKRFFFAVKKQVTVLSVCSLSSFHHLHHHDHHLHGSNGSTNSLIQDPRWLILLLCELWYVCWLLLTWFLGVVGGEGGTVNSLGSTFLWFADSTLFVYHYWSWPIKWLKVSFKSFPCFLSFIKEFKHVFRMSSPTKVVNAMTTNSHIQ